MTGELGLRVLFLSTSYPTDRDDSRGIHIHRLAASLVSAGVDVSVVVPSGRRRGTDYRLDGVLVHPVNYWIPRFQALAVGLGGIVPNIKRRPILILQVPLMVLALGVATLRRARTADVIHAHWVVPGALLGAAFKGGKPLVVTSHGGDIELIERSGFVRTVARWALMRADRCLGVSEAITRRLVELGAPRERCVFQPLGVDIGPSERSPEFAVADSWGDQAGSFRVVFVGSLIERKQPGNLLRAIADLRDQAIPVQAALVGDGHLRKELESDAASAELPVHFAGDTPPRLVSAWLRNADVLVLPSLSEGRPVAIMEAMAAGVPVVASDIPGVRELVNTGITGILVPPHSVESLASALKKLALDTSLARAMGSAGRAKLAAEGLLIDQVATSHVDHYSSLLGAKRE